MASCRGNTTAQAPEKAGRAGPETVEVVKVVEQPLNVTLSLPGELTPYQTVALYARVTGFVKSIAVDLGNGNDFVSFDSLANGGDQNVGLPADSGQVFRAAVAKRYGCVASRWTKVTFFGG
jgi:hypothetical protein